MARGWGTPEWLRRGRVRRRATAAALVLVALLLVGRTASPVVAAALVVVAWGVLRGRRAALPVGCALASWSSVYGVAEGDRDLVVAGGAAVVLILVVRHELVGLLDDGRRRLTAEVAIATIAGGMLAGTAAVLAHPSGWEPEPTLSTAVREAFVHLAGGLGPLSATSREARVAVGVLPVIGAAGALVTVLLLMAPLGEPDDDDGDRARVSGLARQSGDDSLAPFSLRADKRYVFSADRRSAVGYRTLLGVGLASGDPVGPQESRAAAFVAYLAECDANGWVPAVVGAGAETTALARRLGMKALCFGDEAVVDVASFRLDMPPRRNVRQAVQRTKNFGVTTEIFTEHGLPPAVRDQLVEVARLGRNGTPERGFSMILDGLLNHRWAESLIVVCRDRDGAPIAFQRFLPYGQGLGLTLDVMRRSPAAPNGVNERMIVEMIEWARSRGIREVSLNFAAFRDLFESDRGLIGAVEYWLVHRLDRFIKVESLYRFNAKFRPGWRPRYVLFRSLPDIATVLPAALVAEFSIAVPGRRRPDAGAPDAVPVPGRLS